MINKAKLRELCEKATMGPWQLDPQSDRWIVNNMREGIARVSVHNRYLKDDIQLIAASREAIPALLDEIEALEKKVAEARAETWEKAAERAENEKVGANAHDDVADRLHDHACSNISEYCRAAAQKERE